MNMTVLATDTVSSGDQGHMYVLIEGYKHVFLIDRYLILGQANEQL